MGAWENGFVVSNVFEDTPAFDAGMEIGDKIITYGGTELLNQRDLSYQQQSGGDKKTEVIVLRQGSEITLNVIPRACGLDGNNFFLRVVPIKGHTDNVNYATFSKNGKRVVTASNDGTARIWNADTGREFLVLQHDNFVMKAEFIFDGKKWLQQVRKQRYGMQSQE